MHTGVQNQHPLPAPRPQCLHPGLPVWEDCAWRPHPCICRKNVIIDGLESYTLPPLHFAVGVSATEPFPGKSVP